MSKEFVSVPREWLNAVSLMQMSHDELQEQAIDYLCEPCDEPQADAQPVAPPERMTYAEAEELSDHPMTYMNAYDAGLEAGLLYTHADAGDVEQLRATVQGLHEAGEFLDKVAQDVEDKLRAELDTLRTERDALLRDLLDYDISLNARRRVEEALSASAEPTNKEGK